uniref:peroxidase n=1 Tax=Nicotiana tabacum TaxID=4097 RepID=A0A1S4BDC7_TOBAC
DRIYNETNNIDSTFASQRQADCPRSGGDSNLAPLDPAPVLFDTEYFSNLLCKKGLLHSDQALFSGGQTDNLVQIYSTNLGIFAKDFAESMIKMGNIKPLTGDQGQIRVNCRKMMRTSVANVSDQEGAALPVARGRGRAHVRGR